MDFKKSEYTSKSSSEARIVKKKLSTSDFYEKYAKLLVEYCLDIKEDDQLYIKTSLLAEPLVSKVYVEAIKRGANVSIDWQFRNQSKLFMEHAEEAQLKYIAPLYQKAVEDFDAYLFIRAPYDLEEKDIYDEKKFNIRHDAYEELQQLYFHRTSDGSLKRTLCQFPTQANADAAEMSLVEYEKFIFNACYLFDEDPKSKWLEVRKNQQHIVDYLNKADHIRYKGDNFDISFNVKGRTWINSDGRTNMPSGEVFTGPIEDSVNGVVHFAYPSIYMGKEVEGITLWVKDGYIEKWEAKKGQELLDKIFEIKGARRFGEVAIGTNYQIQQPTKNILFDEKIGGTIHMAIGQSYPITGAKNQSPIHWDMIAEMKHNAEIVADGEVIYKDGQFII